MTTSKQCQAIRLFELKVLMKAAKDNGSAAGLVPETFDDDPDMLKDVIQKIEHANLIGANWAHAGKLYRDAIFYIEATGMTS